MRYNYSIKLAAKVCACGEPYSVNHCLTCKKGGYVTLRHNSLRDLLAELLEEICKDVVIEPPLLPLTGENLPPGSNLSDGARLDVSCINLWSPLSRAFIDVRIFNPQAQSNWNKSISAMYTSHQNEKKTEYGPRTREVEKATLTAAVMSTSGGMGKEMDVLVRQIATKLSVKRGERYSDTVGFVRRRIRFDLLRTCVIVVPTRASALGLCFLLPHTVPRISNGACAWEKVDDTWILTIICCRAPRQSPVLWH